MIVLLLRYTDAQGKEHEVSLVQAQHDQPPRIVSNRCDGTKWPGVDVSLGALFDISLRDSPIRQLIGDGPEYAELSADRVRDAAELALRALPPTAGRFRVVWVPDDGLLSEGRALTYDIASPQVEDGHTRIANELLEAMCRAGFSARQWAVVMAVVRKTYGYGKRLTTSAWGNSHL